jgi:hypothetical protein
MPAATKVDPLWQEHLDFLFPRAPMLRPDQIATAFGIDLVTVRRLFERGPDDNRPAKLHGITINAAGGERDTRRILRDSALLLHMQRANYTPDEFLARIAEVLANRSPRELLLVQARIAELIRQKS